jgi:hypothetical protein
VVRTQHVRIDLPKDGRSSVDLLRLPAEEAGQSAFHILGECKLRSRQNAHRRSGILGRGKPSCTGVKVVGRKLVTDLSRTGFDMVQV